MQKSLAWRLIFSGLILVVINTIVYILLVLSWSVFLDFYWVVILLSSVGIISLIIGGIQMKYDLSSWVVLSGAIIIFIVFILSSLFMGLGGNLLRFTTIIPILIFIGLTFIVIGGLTNKK
jgi:hypothetical protein